MELVSAGGSFACEVRDHALWEAQSDTDVAAIRQEGFRSTMQRPKFGKTLLRTDREGAKNVLFTYRIAMTPEVGEATARRMLIHVEKQSDGWRVVDYQFWPDTGASAAPSE